MSNPCPLHFGQAPFELKLNSEASDFVAWANSFLIRSKTPIKVAGFAP
ncbi:MAG: hypothetical protein IPH45_16020 [Bacteroidales bacterium]|nr:hypothetical protein [Bacteroidales bacterium]